MSYLFYNVLTLVSHRTDESSSDDDVLDKDYSPAGDEVDVSEPQEIPVVNEIDVSESQEIPVVTTEKPKSKRRTRKEVSTTGQKKDKTVWQLELVEQFLTENGDPYPLSASQIKCLQQRIQSKCKEKLSLAQVIKLFEIARRHWKKIDKPCEDSVFTCPEGPNIECFSNCHTPADVFSQFLDTEIVDNIVFQTNLYITQKQRNVSPITREEYYGFVGIKMLMSYHKLPSWTHYWNTDPDFNVPFVSAVMTRNRFGQILSNLHVNDNAAIPDGNKDKLYKLRPLINMMNNNYVKLYNVSQKLSVDESMILFKGRHSIKQYNLMKPIKRGYKMWVGADMDGYISKFDVYQ